MFCGGSFKAKTIERNDEYKVVRINNTDIKITRSMSLNKTDRPQGRKIFVMPPKIPGDLQRRVQLIQTRVRFFKNY